MLKHKKIYLNYFGYGQDDFVPCENCGNRAVDIHHIKPKSQLGGNNIDNLCALCRLCHNAAHAEKIDESTLKYMHKCFMNKYKK